MRFGDGSPLPKEQLAYKKRGCSGGRWAEGFPKIVSLNLQSCLPSNPIAKAQFALGGLKKPKLQNRDPG